MQETYINDNSKIDTKAVLCGIISALEGACENKETGAPEFAAALTAGTQTESTGGRKKRSVTFDIRCTFGADAAELICDAADKLAEALCLITVCEGVKMRGTGLHFEVKEDILHFYVSYIYLTGADTGEPAMENLSLVQSAGAE